MAALSREQVSLLRDAFDNVEDAADLLGRRVQSLDGVRRVGDFLADRGHAGDRFVDGFRAGCRRRDWLQSPPVLRRRLRSAIVRAEAARLWILPAPYARETRLRGGALRHFTGADRRLFAGVRHLLRGRAHFFECPRRPCSAVVARILEVDARCAADSWRLRTRAATAFWDSPKDAIIDSASVSISLNVRRTSRQTRPCW